MEHAKVNQDGFEIPLIGISKSATEEKCEFCLKTFHLKDIVLTTSGTPLCKQCNKGIDCFEQLLKNKRKDDMSQTENLTVVYDKRGKALVALSEYHELSDFVVNLQSKLSQAEAQIKVMEEALKAIVESNSYWWQEVGKEISDNAKEALQKLSEMRKNG